LTKKATGKYSKAIYENNKGEQVSKEQVLRLINNKPLGKLSKTKEVKNYKEVDLKQKDDLIIEKSYLVCCDGLLNELETTGKALVFAYTSGNGYKVYKAFLYPSKLYKGFLLMDLATTQKSEVILGMIEGLKQQNKSKETEVILQGIETAKVEDLIEI